MSQDPGRVRDRVLDAAFAVFGAQGLRRGTLGAVATRAGVGRATLYRYFPGKEALVGALVLREARALFTLLDRELEGTEGPAELFERGLLTALAHLRAHPLLQRVLATEPEAVLPALTVHAQPLLEAAIDFVAPYVERAAKAEEIPPVDPRMAAEWAARLLLSLVLTPSVTVDLDDAEQVRGFVSWVTGLSQGGKP